MARGAPDASLPIREEEAEEDLAAAAATATGASRYMSEKLRIEPTTSVENTKSSSPRPQLGLELMSPSTAAPTPMICSTRTL